jgi:hypothetical protein
MGTAAGGLNTCLRGVMWPLTLRAMRERLRCGNRTARAAGCAPKVQAWAGSKHTTHGAARTPLPPHRKASTVQCRKRMRNRRSARPCVTSSTLVCPPKLDARDGPVASAQGRRQCVCVCGCRLALAQVFDSTRRHRVNPRVRSCLQPVPAVLTASRRCRARGGPGACGSSTG